MRLFIAIPFTEKMKTELKGVMSDLRKQAEAGRFTDPGNLHLTLAFIGETDRVRDIANVLHSLSLPEMQIAFDRIGHFGNLYWIGVKEDLQLNQYVASLRQALDDRDIPYDRKPFKPHITLIRKARFESQPKAAVPSCVMDVTKVSLMRSDRVGGRTVYTPVAEMKKKGR